MYYAINMKYSHELYKPEQLGTVIEQSVRCGKSNCHCSQGEKHKANYHYYRAPDEETGKLRLIKKYVPKPQVPILKQEILNRKWELFTYRLGSSKDNEFIERVTDDLPDNKQEMINQFPVRMKKTQQELGRYMNTYPRGRSEMEQYINEFETLMASPPLKQAYKRAKRQAASWQQTLTL